MTVSINVLYIYLLCFLLVGCVFIIIYNRDQYLKKLRKQKDELEKEFIGFRMEVLSVERRHFVEEELLKKSLIINPETTLGKSFNAVSISYTFSITDRQIVYSNDFGEILKSSTRNALRHMGENTPYYITRCPISNGWRYDITVYVCVDDDMRGVTELHKMQKAKEKSIT